MFYPNAEKISQAIANLDESQKRELEQLLTKVQNSLSMYREQVTADFIHGVVSGDPRQIKNFVSLVGSDLIHDDIRDFSPITPGPGAEAWEPVFQLLSQGLISK